MPISKTSKSLVCDVILQHDFTCYDSAQLTIEFVKFLCLQKGQLPVPFSQLQRLINVADKQLQKDDQEIKVKSLAKTKQAAAKSKRQYLQFSKNAENFLRNFEDLSKSISNSFELQNEKVAIILGTSVFNPKETFILDWSECPMRNKYCPSSNGTHKNFKSNQANFFRYLVTAEELFPFFQTMRTTKVHVLCQNHLVAPVGSIPRISYKTNSLRGKHVTFRILPVADIPREISSAENISVQDTSSTATANSTVRNVSRRLIFSSPTSNVKSSSERNVILDLSGFDSLEEDCDIQPKNTEAFTTQIVEKYWFEIQTSLTGFVSTLN